MRYEEVLAQWKEKNIISDAALAEALNGQGVSFAYHSGRIENPNITFHDTREIFDHDGVTSYTGDLHTLFEIRNAKDAYEQFLSAFGEGRALDESLILRFHKLLTKNTYDSRRYELGERPGTYKQHDYVTGKHDVGAAPEDVAEEMRELLYELKDAPQEKALTAAAFFHAKFENIHPFADGNGRCGRLAMNYYLVTQNHPPVTIHEEDRKEYFEALEAWDVSQDLQPLKTFLRAQCVKTWTKK
ncbi:MAG: Fic family protein [Lachnospiraceae bacterium]|nr:Fic family protein [Lachnospiraceae bacterium]